MKRLIVLIAATLFPLAVLSQSAPTLPDDYSPQRCRDIKGRLAEHANPLAPKPIDLELNRTIGIGLYQDFSCDALDAAWHWSLFRKTTLDAASELQRAGINLSAPTAAEQVRSALDSLADSAARIDADFVNVPGVNDRRIQFLDWSRKLFAEHGWPPSSSMHSVFADLRTRIGNEYVDPTELRAVFAVASDRAAGLIVLSNDGAGAAFHLAQAGSVERDQAAKQKAEQEAALAAQSYTGQVKRRASKFPGILNVLLGAAGLVGLSVFFARGYLVTGRQRLIAFVAGTVGLFIATMLIGALQVLSGIPTWLSLLFLLIAFALIYVAFRDKLNARFLRVSTLATHGSAAWATLRDAIGKGRLFNRGMVSADSYGFALGRFSGAPDNLDPRIRYMGHVLTCAPTGSGKGIGAVIPTLLEYPGSILCLDIKGENYAVTARARRALGQAVHLLDPFGVTAGHASAFNPLDVLDLTNPDVVGQASALVEMLVVTGSNQDDSSAHFNDSAKELIKGLIVYAKSLPEPDRRTLGEVRRLLTLPLSVTADSNRESLADHLADMSATDALAFGIPARAANAFMSKDAKEASGVLSTAQRHTAFLDDPRIVAALSRSDFSFADLKRQAMTVYVVMPPDRLASQARFMRTLVGAALSAITATSEKPQFNTLFLLDEFAQLGRLQAIEDAISLVRGYGARFWLFVQDLSQLKGVYPKWQTFLANSAKQFYGTADYETAKYISDMLGQTTIEFRTAGDSSSTSLQGGGSSGTSTSQQLAARSLLTTDEVMRQGPTRPIVLIQGERPYSLERMNYLTNPEYAGMADVNPFHR